MKVPIGAMGDTWYVVPWCDLPCCKKKKKLLVLFFVYLSVRICCHCTIHAIPQLFASLQLPVLSQLNLDWSSCLFLLKEHWLVLEYLLQLKARSFSRWIRENSAGSIQIGSPSNPAALQILTADISTPTATLSAQLTRMLQSLQV